VTHGVWGIPIPSNGGHTDYAANAGDYYLEGNAIQISFLQTQSWQSQGILDSKYFIDVECDLTIAGFDVVAEKMVFKSGLARIDNRMSGVIYAFSRLALGEIRDGTSCTYLCGEKWIHSKRYENGEDIGDSLCMYAGDCYETTRWVGWGGDTIDWPTGTPWTPMLPRRDCPQEDNWPFNSFGSAHAGACNMAFCDGSVRPISYGISSTVHANLANRRDGNQIDGNDLGW
jgi:prepilin-type processing-associated H-X9-DG protein